MRYAGNFILKPADDAEIIEIIEYEQIHCT